MEDNNIKNKLIAFFNGQEIFGKEIFFDEMPAKPAIVNMSKKTTTAKTTVKQAKPKTETTAKNKIVLPSETPDRKLNIKPEDWKDESSLDVLKAKIHTCLNCPLGDTRNHFVFGAGNPNADIMIIGEAPGADEDKQGIPFVGRAGQLLTKILEAIKLSREEVFIGNIIKCRPPGNRRPLPSEVEQCEPYLMKQIELIDPAFILVLGLTAVDTLLKAKHKMAETRGRILDYHGRKMMITYHPSALLRNPKWKKPVWEDVKMLRKLYDEYLETKNS